VDRQCCTTLTASARLCFVTPLSVSRDLHATRYGLRFDIHAVSDSSGFIRSSTGAPLTDDQLTQALKFKLEHRKPFASQSLGAAGDARAVVAAVLSADEGKPTIVVDATGSDDTGSALLDALRLGAAVTMANKKPLAGRQSLFDSLTHPSFRARLRFESTVGAGTPFVATTSRVVASGDQVQRVQGSFSGTLGYVMSGLEAGKSYSGVVVEAARQGFTEPDPRDDLGGVDVARKALILARLMGWRAEMTDVAIEPLYPAAFSTLSVKEFMDQLPTQDEVYAEKVRQAKQDGYVLRYVANIEAGKISVGLMVRLSRDSRDRGASHFSRSCSSSHSASLSCFRTSRPSPPPALSVVSKVPRICWHCIRSSTDRVRSSSKVPEQEAPSQPWAS
jgi:homoserine dehydrogenase